MVLPLKFLFLLVVVFLLSIDVTWGILGYEID